ncbi:MAG: hypothetical protein KatS3mg105_4124 [Gemmatales bacterium]|nr:MAG: hypothetical protein KatS3mg105_4124 [Gemmatales bacterium]
MQGLDERNYNELETDMGFSLLTDAVPGGADYPIGSPNDEYLDQLLEAYIVHYEDWDNLPSDTSRWILQQPTKEEFIDALLAHELLTPYQARRLRANHHYHLTIGNYRILDQIGTGGMGRVYKAEHVQLRRPVALKVLEQHHGDQPRALLRFSSELRALARLNHPNIVSIFDAGSVADTDFDLHYYVMELVDGVDLEEMVEKNGPLPIEKSCGIAHQIAAALAEANRHQLIHRDIKPSNVIVTPDGVAKLLDFGLVRQFNQRLTEPNMAMGTLEFMSPEQARDAAAVDIRTDIYGLGATLYWCLAGQSPFPSAVNFPDDLLQRLTAEPPLIRAVRPDIPEALERIITTMMANNPDDRYDTPEAVMRALEPYCLKPKMERAIGPSPLPTPAPAGRILVVDDDDRLRQMCRLALENDGYVCDEATNAAEAVLAHSKTAYDLIQLDVDLPDQKGDELLQQLRDNPSSPNQKIMMVSGKNADELAQLMIHGADDFLHKPFSIAEYMARVKCSLRLKNAQDRSARLHQRLLAINTELEQSLQAKNSDFNHARNALILALAKLVELRGVDPGAHLTRMRSYCRVLAAEAARLPNFANQINDDFIETLSCCAPLHDIGNIALPDDILLKTGSYTPEERKIMESHTTLGAFALGEVAKFHGLALGFLQMAIDIARHHHERFDGQGYPDRLSGLDIPLSARIVSIADTYDSLRMRRPGRPPLRHAAAVQIIHESPGQFDPLLLQAFDRCADQFRLIFESSQS